MSRTAKATFLATSLLAGFTVWGVHYLQVAEREQMYRGVLADDARQLKRREQMAREQEFEEQKARRVYLEGVQPVSNAVGPRPELPKQGVDGKELVFEGCKTC